MSRKFETPLGKHMENYLVYKRNMGLKYETPSDVLYSFDAFCLKNGYQKDTLEREITMTFLERKPNERMGNVTNKSTILRGFGRYLRDIVKKQNVFIVPSLSLRGEETYIPYIFTDKEIRDIIYHAQNYTSHTPVVLPNIRNAISCIITTLYCTGMRVSEVCNLKIEEVDLVKGLLYVNEAKNDNKRIVTMSDSLIKEYLRYIEETKSLEVSNRYFFDAGVSRNDGYIPRDRVYYYFRKILKKSRIKHRGKGVGPRLHDVRHTFCCHSLRKLSKMDGDINAYIVYLSTYLGHKSILETQRYIWLTADLFEDTLTKMEEYTSFVSTIYQNGDKYDEGIL